MTAAPVMLAPDIWLTVFSFQAFVALIVAMISARSYRSKSPLLISLLDRIPFDSFRRGEFRHAERRAKSNRSSAGGCYRIGHQRGPARYFCKPLLCHCQSQFYADHFRRTSGRRPAPGSGSYCHRDPDRRCERTCRTSDQLDQKLRPRKWLAQTDQRPKRLILRQQCLELEVPHRLVERFLLLVPRPQFRSLLLSLRNCCVTLSPTKS